jgi:hypothetical protein
MSRGHFSASCAKLRKKLKIIYWERFSQSVIFPINVWKNHVAFMHLPSPPLSFKHLRRHYFRQTIDVWLNNATLIELE